MNAEQEEQGKTEKSMISNDQSLAGKEKSAAMKEGSMADREVAMAGKENMTRDIACIPENEDTENRDRKSNKVLGDTRKDTETIEANSPIKGNQKTHQVKHRIKV